MNIISRISQARTAVTIISVTLAVLACGAASASAKAWYLTVRPARISPGGSVVIKTTAGRRCSLVVRLGARNYHFSLPRRGQRITVGRAAPLGRAGVTVYCRGLVAKNSFTVAPAPTQPAATQPAPTTPAPTTPAPTAPAPTPQQTPVTVANVCALNPGLGTVHYMTSSQGYPTAYWMDGSKLTLMAFSDDGDSAVDVAAVVAPDGQSIAYFARCNWSGWLDVAQYQAAQTQAGVPPAQSSSLGYLLEEQTNDAAAQEDEEWFTPSAGIQECPTNPYETCDIEPVDDDS